MSKVGFIGLGQMGGAMARHLLANVDTLLVHDRSPTATERLVAAGAVACADAAEIARQCDLIFLCLPYAPQVREALFGADGIAQHARPELTVIDTTTLNRKDALDIAAQARQAGVIYWDCPISGAPVRAESGTLTVMFGGTQEAFVDIEPYLESFGSAVIHCGPLGSGQAMKALNNILYDVHIAALAEVLPLATSLGLDPEKVGQVVVSGSSRSFASEHFVPRMLEGRFDGDFPMDDAYKDIVNVREMATEKSARLPVVEAMVASYEGAMRAGHATEPKSAMLKIFEAELGVRFRKPGFEEAED